MRAGLIIPDIAQVERARADYGAFCLDQQLSAEACQGIG